MKRSESIKEMAASLAKAQVQFESAIRDHTAKVQMKSGGQYSFAYADLAAYLDVCRKPLGDNGIAFLQEAIVKGREVSVTTLLIHSSGESIESEPFVLSVVARGGDGVIDPQSIGSAVTYARRYSLASLIGMASEVDDDGNRASGNKATIENNQHRQPAKPQPTNGTPAPPLTNGAAIPAPGQSVFITMKQYADIKAACEDTGASLAKVIAANGATKGSEIKAADFSRIMERIKAKDPAFAKPIEQPQPAQPDRVPGELEDEFIPL